MKRIVSIAAGVFVALFISFLGLAVSEEINRYNQQKLDDMDKPNIVLETQETDIWDYIRELNTTTTEEIEETIDTEQTGESIAETTENAETTKRVNSNRKEKTTEMTKETSVPEITTEETRLTIVVR